MKLHLGCGFDYRKGWVNVDRLRHVKVDVLHDLDEYPYPFAGNTFSVVYSDGLVEHLDDLIMHFEEIWRICKKNAKIEFKVPFALSQNNFADFTHMHSFTLNSMSRICDNVEGRKYIKGKFDFVSAKPIRGGVGYFFPNFINSKLCHVIGEVYQSIIFEIQVKK